MKFVWTTVAVPDQLAPFVPHEFMARLAEYSVLLNAMYVWSGRIRPSLLRYSARHVLLRLQQQLLQPQQSSLPLLDSDSLPESLPEPDPLPDPDPPELPPDGPLPPEEWPELPCPLDDG